jgi:hypothetical protein
MTIAAGQCWAYRTAAGFETSRMTIGAILTFADGSRVICCSVGDAPRLRPDGSVDRAPIPFLPLSEAAFRASVTQLAGEAEPDPSFASALAAWHSDPQGLSTFTVPFDGYLDRLIARQMSEIAGRAAA